MEWEENMGSYRWCLAVSILLLACAPLSAQWLDYRAPGVPRTADGKPNLRTPARRTADGKPDLSGVWDMQEKIPCAPGGCTCPAQQFLNIAWGVKDGLPYRPGMAELAKARQQPPKIDEPLTRCLPVPAGLSDVQAASLPETFFTVWSNVFQRAHLTGDETFMVQGGSSGIGAAAIQIATALGHRVFATAGSDEKCRACEALGAERAINYRSEDFVEVVKRETNGRGADVIYDPVGGETGERSTKCIAFEGRLIVIGFTSGKFPSFVGNHILVKNYSVVGLHWGAYRQHNPAKIELEFLPRPDPNNGIRDQPEHQPKTNPGHWSEIGVGECG